MPEYDNTNRGVLFRNNDRKTDKHPEFTGKIDVDGIEYRLAAWVKESKNGNKFFSLSVSEPRTQGTPERKEDDMSDPIPF